MFSVLNAVILRPAAYPQPGQLMFVTSRFPSLGFNQFWVSPPEYFELTEINQSFSSLGAYVTSEANVSPRIVLDASTPASSTPSCSRRWPCSRTRDAGFDVMRPRTNGPRLVMLSSELWQSAFASRSDIVGKTIEVDGAQNEVVGIMPPGFDVMDNHVEIWMPLHSIRQIARTAAAISST